MIRTRLFAGLALGAFTAHVALAEDWTDWRGPLRDGHSFETNLPTSWSPDGENLAWRAPHGGRSTPIVLGDHLYLQNAVGEGAERQERLMCFNADTGELLWEHRMNIFMSDVPPHRVGWASPVADPTTENVFVYTVGGLLVSLSSEGELLWERSLNEDFGLITTHGGRTASPVIDGDLLIVSGLSSGWGEQARGSQRFFAFDKATGDTRWVSSPGGRPYDTTYAPPYITELDGIRVLITGGGDGAMHAIKPQTGEPLWRFEYSKRGINTGAIVKDGVAVVSQGEENLSHEPDGARRRDRRGRLAATSPSEEREAGLMAASWEATPPPCSTGTGSTSSTTARTSTPTTSRRAKQLWKLNLGTIQRASPVIWPTARSTWGP